MSEAGSMYMASRPPTDYFQNVQIPTTQSPQEFDYGQGGPSDAELEQAVRSILHGADLNTITKKAVRQRLEAGFGVDLMPRKAVINAAIDRAILAEQA